MGGVYASRQGACGCVEEPSGSGGEALHGCLSLSKARGCGMDGSEYLDQREVCHRPT